MGGIGKSIPPIFYHAFEVPISDLAKTTMPRKKGSGAIEPIDAAKQDPFEIHRSLHAGGEPTRDKHALLLVRWRACARSPTIAQSGGKLVRAISGRATSLSNLTARSTIHGENSALHSLQ
jgi:hypothetical protein